MKNISSGSFLIFGILTLGSPIQTSLKSFADPLLPDIVSPTLLQNSEQAFRPDLTQAALSHDSLGTRLIQGPLSVLPLISENPSVPTHTMNTSHPVPLFSVQAGVGLTLQPLRFIFATHENVYLLQSGVGGHIFLRAHPKVTLDLGISILVSTYSTATQYWVHELPTIFGIRIHLDNNISSIKRTLFSPYLLIALGINFSQLLTQQQQGLEQAIYFETQAGVGIEFKLPRNFALTLDLRGLFNARLDSQTESFFTTLDGIVRPSLANIRWGCQVTLGIVGYF